MTASDLTDWPQQAGILCNDEAFRRFVAERMQANTGLAFVTVTTEAAAEYLRRFCHIQSRRDLATNIDARARFRILRTEFDAWSGRIASQR
jgi:hypothetical protein